MTDWKHKEHFWVSRKNSASTNGQDVVEMGDYFV